jgi:hypothetical protein
MSYELLLYSISNIKRDFLYFGNPESGTRASTSDIFSYEASNTAFLLPLIITAKKIAMFSSLLSGLAAISVLTNSAWAASLVQVPTATYGSPDPSTKVEMWIYVPNKVSPNPAIIMDVRIHAPPNIAFPR